ncbi:MAG: hypothetical protein A3G66_01370 [Candidatus Levybacteria bacterium RIFCSPLOWO2_12_FULL_39_17]|nr:MAG: hypothetical protein UT20_C0002G0006 [Candidatus Levybacteria bacterium GW2011_GWA1_39_11]OGH15339.1 MAG: hypothetical protein A2689_02245 [Candidatus Levybacteria bacterium RIFCSPHIGHO2_01_FULL_38_96]OGH36371.1 MAG: hypothetical protein A3B43_02925 [Candidatus Levybacteria bacterium RIFCSPLOWO2_01_FULL_38_120]OGH47103.1 MAG: hypothetical protein A3G66_01370 [Candidatus Levybacteria bacterium RIFCSPLOWO2_12_FULL_39_17]
MLKFIQQNLNLFLYFFLSVFSILPFFSPGFFTVHDDTQVARVFEMGKSLNDGMFPVRWVQDLGYGYGYPIFNFYAPLPYYVGGFLTLIGFDSLVATKIIFALALILSGVSMFVLVKEFFGKSPALVSSVVYLYFPYHAVNTYVRGDLAELFAYAFLPLVFLSLFKIHYNSKISRFYLILGALSIAAVVISHNLSAFMLFIFIFLFIVLSLFTKKERKRLVFSYLFILLTAFLLSAFYSLPALFEMKYTNVLSQVGGGSHYADHFICPSQLWNSAWGFGGSAPTCVDGMSFKLGKLNILLSIFAFGLFLINFKKNKDKLFIISFSLVSLLLSIFLTLEYSSIIWRLPFMDFLQFPWRFLNFTGLFISIVVGYLIWQGRQYLSNKISIALASIIILLTLTYNAALFNPKTIDDRDNSFYTNETYLKWTVSGISDEYLPKDFRRPESKNHLRESSFDIISGRGETRLINKKTQEVKATASLETNGLVRANIAFFPAWEIRVDGKKAFYAAREDGLYLNVPSGFHVLTAELKETLVERIGNALSLIGVLALLIVIIRKSDTFYGQKTS